MKRIIELNNEVTAENVLVVYGGVSPEHEVAVVTALQVMYALIGAGYNVMPLYISKTGNWFLGDESFMKPGLYKDLAMVERKGKRVVISPDGDWGLLSKGWLGFSSIQPQPDVVFPVIHGKGGEDGTLQGLLELADLPYVGCPVTASGIKIDKYLAKRVANSIGIPVLKDSLAIKGEKVNVEGLKFPVFVKPVGLGSSIGLSRVEKKSDLDDALEVAFCYDSRVMIEEGMNDFSEVNISIIGNNPYELSLTEQPVASGDVLSFADKYTGQSGKNRGMAGAKRYIPAKVSEKVIKTVEDYAKRFFRVIGGKGIARVDFMVVGDKVYFNEINTLPGSLAFYLWEKSNLPFVKLVKKLVELAVSEHEQKKGVISTFESNILASFANNGLKGGKK